MGLRPEIQMRAYQNFNQIQSAERLILILNFKRQLFIPK
jgi:hypothetical protein